MRCRPCVKGHVAQLSIRRLVGERTYCVWRPAHRQRDVWPYGKGGLEVDFLAPGYCNFATSPDIPTHTETLGEHGVSFEFAARVFDDPYALSVAERVVDHEERWRTIGLVEDMLLLLVAQTWRSEEDDEMVRIISARKATPHERRSYEQSRKENRT